VCSTGPFLSTNSSFVIIAVAAAGAAAQMFAKDHAGVWPSYWPQVVALAGGHNGVPGIRGIGPVRAVQYVNKLVRGKEGVLTDLLNRNKKAGWDMERFKRNVRMATYPYPGLELVLVPTAAPIEYDEREFIKYLSRLGISITSTMRNAMERLSHA
jgi:5'-3' exonuclease